MKVLAIGAHPDDIEYYAGGTLAKMIDEGHEVVFVVATDGRNGADGEIEIEELIGIRKKEQEKSAKVIGVKKVIHLDYEDGSLEDNIKGLKQDLLDILVKEQPSIVFTFDPQKQYILHEDFHPDHRSLAVAALDVIMIDYTLPKKAKLRLKRPRVFLYNAHKTNKKIDISTHLLKKKSAIKTFASQNLRLGSVSFEKFRVY